MKDLILKLLPDNIISKTGKVSKNELFKHSKFFGLLFSGQWCPPCRKFCNLLVNFYKDLNNGKKSQKEIEIIFVSSDEDKEGFVHHYKNMPWYAVPFEWKHKQEIPQLFKVGGIPNLVILSCSDGKILDKAAGSTIRNKGLNALKCWEIAQGLKEQMKGNVNIK